MLGPAHFFLIIPLDFGVVFQKLLLRFLDRGWTTSFFFLLEFLELKWFILAMGLVVFCLNTSKLMASSSSRKDWTLNFIYFIVKVILSWKFIFKNWGKCELNCWVIMKNLCFWISFFRSWLLIAVKVNQLWTLHFLLSWILVKTYFDFLHFHLLIVNFSRFSFILFNFFYFCFLKSSFLQRFHRCFCLYFHSLLILSHLKRRIFNFDSFSRFKVLQ